MTFLKSAVVIFSFFLTSQTALNTMTGSVVAVSSGDTLTISVNKENFQIRLADVDCPEVRQPFFSQALRFTEDRTLGKKIRVNYEMIDSYKRVVGEVILPDGNNLNIELMRAGLAWHYRVKPKPSEILARLEYDAWSHKIGLWVEPNPMPPWQFRRDPTVTTPPAGPTDVDYDQIMSYGLVGDKKNRVYLWPACQEYRIIDQEDLVVFSSLFQATSFGFKKHKSCEDR